MGRVRRRAKAGGAGETSKQTKPEDKTPASLKPELKIAKKSPSRNSPKSKASKSSLKPGKPNTEDRKEQNSKTNKDRKEKNPSGARDQKDQDSNEKLGGMIFMCNRNTKSDCYRYMVMGFPEGKRDIVMNIKPDMKLFLYDFDSKLLYGVYKATSAGGMKLEPSAFNGSYPAQVRFKVHLDCQPLPEDVFKNAIRENVDSKRNFFKTELTNQHVRKLIQLFRSATPAATAIPAHPLPGLVPQVPMMPAVYVHTDREVAPTGVPRDPLSLSEKEYRMYGLKPRAPASVAPATVAPALDPRYGSREYPYGTGLAPMRSAYDLPRSYTRPVGADVEYRVATDEAGRYHSAHAASDYQLQRRRGDPGALPVSARYSFAGPASSYR